jgi:phosphate transport system substrate-binding protein
MKRMFAFTQDAESRRGMAQAVLLAMGVVASAGAQAATVYGGGATLPAVGYEGNQALGGTTDTRLTVDPSDTSSLFGQVQSTYGFTLSYCETGSGTGKKVLGQWTSYAADNACGTFSQASVFGFSAPSARPDFGASDAPLAQSEYNSVITNVSTAPVQFPVVAGAIAIIYNNSSVTSQLNLTDSQVCEIFSGKITNWSQISSASGAIKLVYRTDGSGTSFSLSNHLANVCTSSAEFTSGTYPTVHFTTDQTFTNVVAASGGLPSGAIGASGNPGVVAAVAANADSIGYGEVADALAHDPTLTYATVNSEDPVNNLANTFSITTGVGEVVTVNGSNGQATLGAITSGSQTQCVVVANPSTYAVPSSGYPIVAVSNLLGLYSGNANAADVRDLLNAPFNATIQNNASDIGSGTGLAWVDDTSGHETSTLINSCIN